MRSSLLLLLLVSSIFACLPTTSDALANSTINLTDCLFLTDKNITIYNPVKQYDTQWVLSKTNIAYSNSEANISAVLDEKTFMENKIVNIPIGNNVTNVYINTTYVCENYNPPFYNKTLGYSEVFSANNVTCNAPVLPNQTVFCAQNVSMVSDVGYWFNNSLCNISIRSKNYDELALNVRYDLGFGEGKTTDKYNVTCAAPLQPDAQIIKLNVETNLSDTECYNNNDAGLNVCCNAPVKIVEVLGNVSQNATLSINDTSYLAFCTGQEVLSDNGLACLNRITNQSATINQDCQNQLTKSRDDYTECYEREKRNWTFINFTNEKIDDYMLIAAGILALIVGAFLYVKWYKVKDEPPKQYIYSQPKKSSADILKEVNNNGN